MTVRRPRVRALEERFESRVLPLFAKRTAAVSELLPELYLHGLAGRMIADEMGTARSVVAHDVLNTLAEAISIVEHAI